MNFIEVEERREIEIRNSRFEIKTRQDRIGSGVGLKGRKIDSSVGSPEI